MMQSLRQKNLFVGGIFSLIGAVGLYSAWQLDVGTITHLGPGGFPALLSAILLLLGLANIAKVQFTLGETISREGIKGRIVLIPLAVLIFSVSIDRFGLLPSVFITSVIGSFANAKVRLVEVLIISALLAVICSILFVSILGLPFQIIHYF